MSNSATRFGVSTLRTLGAAHSFGIADAMQSEQVDCYLAQCLMETATPTIDPNNEGWLMLNRGAVASVAGRTHRTTCYPGVVQVKVLRMYARGTVYSLGYNE